MSCLFLMIQIRIGFKNNGRVMAEDNSNDNDENSKKDLDLDDDLADALSSDESTGGGEDINVDELLSEVDPDFSSEVDKISSEDFAGVVIGKDKVSEEVDEEAEVPSVFKTFIANIPTEKKNRYMLAASVVTILIPLAMLIFMGKILPTFELPYLVSMDEVSKDVRTYPTDGVQVPLFDEFRSKAFTIALPKAMINLKTDGGSPSYGQFEFFINIRDKELAAAIKSKQSEMIDIMQRVLEEVTWDQLQSPTGKERVKKVIRHRLNEFLQGNIVLGVYYRSVILQK